jgi:hypothetical protein
MQNNKKKSKILSKQTKIIHTKLLARLIFLFPTNLNFSIAKRHKKKKVMKNFFKYKKIYLEKKQPKKKSQET